MGEIVYKVLNRNDKNLLEKIVLFDRSIFPIGEDYSFPDGYFDELYKDTTDLVIAALLDSEVIAYVNAIFLSDEGLESYLCNRDYLSLVNIGLQEGNNNMYFYTIAIDQRFRDTDVIKDLMCEFCKYIEKQRENGNVIVNTITEVITSDGISSALRMGFIPVDVDSNGLGIYEHHNIYNYVDKMINLSFDGGEKMRILG